MWQLVIIGQLVGGVELGGRRDELGGRLEQRG
jgi:hypothetical protein